MEDGFTEIRGPLLLFDWILFCYVACLAGRILHQFYWSQDNAVSELIWQVKYASIIALAFFCLCKASFIASFMYFTIDYKPSKKLPIAWIIPTGICYAIGMVALYALFMIRLYVSFDGTVYTLKKEDFQVLYSWITITVVTASIGSVLWDRNLKDNDFQRMIALMFIAMGGLSHISMNMYFVKIFVGRLRDLLRQSTHLTIRASGTGEAIASTAKVKEVMKSMSTIELADEENLHGEDDDDEDDENLQSDIPTSIAVLRPGFIDVPSNNLSSTIATHSIAPSNNSNDMRMGIMIEPIVMNATPIPLKNTPSNSKGHKRSATPGSPSFQAMAQSARKLVVQTISIKDLTLEERAVRNVMKNSEIEDKTMVVVMVRYTLLKIVSVLSSFVALICVILIMAIDVEKSKKNKKIHETEIVIFFLSLDVSMNVTCLFFTFYSFGFWMFQYNLLCGCLEGLLMHGFESWLKQDFYEQLLVEAKTAVDLAEGEWRESFKRQRSDSRTNSGPSDSRITSETRSRTRSGIASALI